MPQIVEENREDLMNENQNGWILAGKIGLGIIGVCTMIFVPPYFIPKMPI